MSKRHLKTINAPRSWPIERKGKFWITRPNPGPHTLAKSIPIGVIFTDLLKYTKTVRELRKIIHQEAISVNGKVINTPKFPVGLFDVIALKDGESYRLLFNNRGKFTLNKIEDKNNVAIFKIIDKKIMKKGKVQLNLENGNNVLYDKKDIDTGDSVTFEKGKINNILKFEKGACVYLSGGKHVSMVGNLESFEGKKVTFTKGKEKFETLKKYAFVIGDKKPLITIKDE